MERIEYEVKVREDIEFDTYVTDGDYTDGFFLGMESKEGKSIRVIPDYHRGWYYEISTGYRYHSSWITFVVNNEEMKMYKETTIDYTIREITSRIEHMMDLAEEVTGRYHPIITIELFEDTAISQEELGSAVDIKDIDDKLIAPFGSIEEFMEESDASLRSIFEAHYC